jgi:hypothetical protein
MREEGGGGEGYRHIDPTADGVVLYVAFGYNAGS